MKTFLLILSITTINSAKAQLDSYKIIKSDTIELSDLAFKRVLALHFDQATILLNYDLFMKHLAEERNRLKKEIKSRERMIKRGIDYPGITSSQLKSYQSQFALVDSMFSVLKHEKLDTVHVDYNIFKQVNSPLGHFLPLTIENMECMVLDLDNHKQKFIIKISGSKKTGEMTAVGSSFYFIPGATKYFLSTMDWVS